MTEKRFVERYAGRTKKSLIGIEDIETNRVCVTIEENIRLLNELNDKNNQLKQRIKDLLYQIGEVGKNNKTCRECSCFIPEHKYCWMWDMEVEADDVVVACDQRKVKEVILND